jgi:hypothetical protein
MFLDDGVEGMMDGFMNGMERDTEELVMMM